MKKITFLLCTMVLSVIGHAQGIETFANLDQATGDGNGMSSSYQGWTWTGDNDEVWNATDARTDQTINGSAITVRNGSLTTVIPGGIGDLTLTTQRKYSGGSGDITIFIDGVSVGTIPYSDTVQTTTISGINVAGNVTLVAETPGNGDRVAMDDLIWTDPAGGGFDCPNLNANIGDPCDDGDPTTENDTVTENCECVGEPIDMGDVCGFETFDNAQLTGSYQDGSFVGNNGVTWTYVASRDENGDNNNSGIDGNAIMLRRASDGSKITSSAVSGGIADFSVKLYKGFTGGGNRQAELLVNGVSQGLSDPFDDFNEHLFTVTGIDLEGDVIIEIRNNTNKQLIVDDIQWTCFSGEIFDCPNLGANIGDPCDDGDPNTENDVVTEDCECLGTPVIAAEDYFVTTWMTTTANESITIPTAGDGYDYLVDWGDGNVDTGLAGDAVHTYQDPGTYTVKIHGDFPRIYFNLYGDSDKIMSIEQWGNIQWTSMNSAFMGASNMVGNATDIPDLSLVTDMYGMFAYANSYAGDVNMNAWDVSNVTNMHGLFGAAWAFNADISAWDVSNVTNMKFMFGYAHAFNQDIGGWDVTNVKNMDSMFRLAFAFDQDLSAWNVGSVLNMNNMFKGTELSTANYDALLNGWSALSLQSNITLHAGNSTYCDGEMARQEIMDTYNWTFIDDGMDCGAAPRGDMLGMDETASLSEITLYPNPMQDQLTLVNPKNISLQSAAIYDLAGRLITTIDLRGMAAEKVVDVSGLSSATYLVKITGDNSGEISKLMIKQ